MAVLNDPLYFADRPPRWSVCRARVDRRGIGDHPLRSDDVLRHGSLRDDYGHRRAVVAQAALESATDSIRHGLPVGELGSCGGGRRPNPRIEPGGRRQPRRESWSSNESVSFGRATRRRTILGSQWISLRLDRGGENGHRSTPEEPAIPRLHGIRPIVTRSRKYTVPGNERGEQRRRLGAGFAHSHPDSGRCAPRLGSRQADLLFLAHPDDRARTGRTRVEAYHTGRSGARLHPAATRQTADRCDPHHREAAASRLCARRARSPDRSGSVAGRGIRNLGATRRFDRLPGRRGDHSDALVCSKVTPVDRLNTCDYLRRSADRHGARSRPVSSAQRHIGRLHPSIRRDGGGSRYSVQRALSGRTRSRRGCGRGSHGDGMDDG